MRRKQFTQLPAAPAHYELFDPATAQRQKDKAFRAAEKCHNQHTSFLPVLQTGSQVTLQDPHTGLWNQEGIISKVREHNLFYIVQVGNILFVRSRKCSNSQTMNELTLYRKTTEFFSHFQQLQQPVLPQPIHLSPTASINMGGWF